MAPSQDGKKPKKLRLGFKSSGDVDAENNSSSDQYSLEYEQQSREQQQEGHQLLKVSKLRASAALGSPTKTDNGAQSSASSSSKQNDDTNSPTS